MGPAEATCGQRQKRKESAATDRGIRAAGGSATDGDTFFRQRLASCRGTTPAEEGRWRRGIFEGIREEMQMQGERLTIGELCESVKVSRASYYRNWRKKEPKQEQLALREAIQRLAVRDRNCGYRRIRQWLQREGWIVNHKRVLRLMREDNLLS